MAVCGGIMGLSIDIKVVRSIAGGDALWNKRPVDGLGELTAS